MNILKNLTFILLTFSVNLSYAQYIQFEHVPPLQPSPLKIPVFEGVYSSSIAFADIDGDNDQDVLITGYNPYTDQNIAKLYKNDGLGEYSEIEETPFEGVFVSSIAFADIDGDNDQDVLITGATGSNDSEHIGKLYSNDGSGNFTEIKNTPFEGVYSSSIAFADIDGDNDQDVLITGEKSSKEIGYRKRITKLYSNDGKGNYTEVQNTPFEGVAGSSIAFADIDGDNDQDVLITGQNITGDNIAQLFRNNGSGDFSLQSNTPFEGVAGSSIAFADIDGDNDQDVLITGLFNAYRYNAKIYINDGTGNYSLKNDNFFEGVHFSSIAFADIDGDNDQDVLITGATKSGERTSKLYTNDGTGNFSLVSNTPFDGVEKGSIGFADIDGDNDQDVLITGYLGKDGSVPGIARLYINNGIGDYNLVKETPFEGTEGASFVFADIDGDNDQDVLVAGLNYSNKRATKLYTNDGDGHYNEVIGTPFDGVSGSIAFADIDGDNDQDVLITGFLGYGGSVRGIAKLYTNDGTGNFTIVNGTPFEGVAGSSIAFADIDGDNDQDVLITGINNSNQRIAKLYINDGTGTFTLKNNTPFDGVVDSSIGFADIDGDNDQDVLITGFNNSWKRTAKLYTNDGIGNFSLVSNTPFEGVFYSSIAFADIDGDNDQDVLITGQNELKEEIANLYSNDGTGKYTLINNTPFEELNLSSVTFSDIDRDNDQDVLITGYNLSDQRFSGLYLNDGSGNYSLFRNSPFDEFPFSSIALTDIDGDMDQDILITGQISSQVISRVYRNTPCFPSIPLPDLALLSAISGECSVNAPTAPTANNGCGITITATTNATFPITIQDTTTITWTYDDGNGNINTQDQEVIVNDIVNPVPNVASLPTIISKEVVTHLEPPTAIDNCTGTITATTDATFPITTQGTTTVTWNYNDGNGNVFSQNQDVVIEGITGEIKEQNIGITTYPNPTNKSIIISFEQEENEIELVLTTINGQEIYKEHYNSLSNTEIPINGERGIYFLFIKSDQGQRIVKILKN